MKRTPPIVQVRQGFFAARGGLQLRQRSWEPRRTPKAALLLVHGYAEHSGRYQDLAALLNEAGIAVYSFDHRGHGESEGRRAFIANFDNYLDDVDLFIEHTRPRMGNSPLFIMGQSMGGLIVALHAIERKPQAAGLLLCSAALKIGDDVSPLLQRLSGLLAAIVPGVPLVTLDPKCISRDPRAVRLYEDDSLNYHGRIHARSGDQMLRAIRRLQNRAADLVHPVLLIHGTGDRLCDFRGSQELYDRASSSDKTLNLYDGGYHELHHDLDKDTVITDVINWMLARS